MPRSYTKVDHDFLARRLDRKIEDISDLKIHRFFPRVRTDEHVCHVKSSYTTGDHDFPEVIVASTILPGSLPVSPRGKRQSTRIYGCAYRLFTRTRTRTRKRFCILWSLLNSLAGLIIINLWSFYRTVCALLKRDMSIINDEDDASNTPLHVAALNGNDKVAKELLDRGAAIDAR